jgi:hypothetical protein
MNNEDTLFEVAEKAWEQIEFDSGLKDLTIDNYDAVRTAFIEGYLRAVREIKE